MEEILFIFGPARGGTTFVNKLMNHWFSVGTGPEGTFISATIKQADKIGDLSQDDNCRKLAEFISRSQTLEIIRSRWAEEFRFDVTPDDILKRMPDQTVASAVYGAFKSIADYSGKDRAGNKNPGYTSELFELQSLFPDNARYLFVMRDGRDVALSLKLVSWGGQSVYEAAKMWATSVAEVQQFEQQLDPGKLLTVKYEQLLSSPENTMQKIGQFMGAEDSLKIASDYSIEAENSEFNNNYDKWRAAMSPSDQRIYEAVAGPCLTAYGYERQYPDARLSLLEKMRYEIGIFVRLIRLNLYHGLSALPQDKEKWQSSRLTRIFQPGKANPRK